MSLHLGKCPLKANNGHICIMNPLKGHLPLLNMKNWCPCTWKKVSLNRQIMDTFAFMSPLKGHSWFWIFNMVSLHLGKCPSKANSERGAKTWLLATTWSKLQRGTRKENISRIFSELLLPKINYKESMSKIANWPLHWYLTNRLNFWNLGRACSGV